ncbi:uncharacterized protein DUF4270 [Algoriphagus boseongensis]|uniref:Uncharacterized protein DUF4270 n=1 Tax=Algoriphagus boseongensis TaxID=1442587 RepID=A0A4R6T5L4_9BACT|nr:DUF4270 family protein [Algoriphagus boseongensis]TDQ17299.1 uncharacterized protein DUF4270 [Algoriphagus boseongensis]
MKSYTAFIPVSPVKLAISALFSILLFNSSCSDPSTVGIELAPGNNQIGVFYKEFELDANVILLDSFSTTNSTLLIAGHEEDDFFGVTEATGYSRMYLDVTAQRPRNDAIYDSSFFSLDIVSVNGSDLKEPKLYSVHRLSEPILDTAYYNFDKLAFLPQPLASTEVVFGETKDTTLIFPLEESFAEEMFVKLSDSRQFQTLFQFRDYFPGFAVKARKGDNTTAGIALGGETSMTFYYHYAGDTSASEFTISTFSSRSFNGIQSDRSGTPTSIVTERGKTYDVGQIVGMKSALAMALKIDTSPIDAFLDTLTRVTFNQVNLNIGTIEEQDKDNNPINSMVLKFIDSNNRVLISSLPGKNELHVVTDGQPQVIEDENGKMVPNNLFAASAILSYNTETKVYNTRITSHVNAIYRDQLQRQDWLLFAETPTTGIDFRRSLRQFKVNKDKIKVQIIYSKTR